MGKIFDALYAADEKQVDAREQAPFYGESVDSSPDDYVITDGEVDLDGIVQPLGDVFDGNAKWRRDMRKIVINLMVQVDPQELGSKVVMFAGMSARAGTSTVTAQAAKILASEYPKHRVLIIEMPGKRSRDSRPTLDEAMADGYDAEQIIMQCVGEGVFHVELSSTANQEDSARISHYLKAFIREARDHFDWVLLDMPRIGSTPLTDSAGRTVDGVALVANTGSTRVPAINAVEDDMVQLGINLVGVILNFRRYPIPSWLLRFL